MVKQRLYTLDLIKFVAALFLMFHHYQYLSKITFSGPINFYGGTVYVGFLVELFFLISGMLCEAKAQQSSQMALGAFLKEKCLRIYPMAVASICFYAMAAYVYRMMTGGWYWGETIGIWKLLSSGLLIFSGGAVQLSEPGINNPTWYLSVLMICYALYGIVLRVAKRKKINRVYFYVAILFLGIGILDYGINLPFANAESARGYISFFAGGILWQVNKKYAEKIKKRIGMFFGGAVVFLVIFLVFSGRPLVDNQQYILTFILYPLCLLWMVNSDRLNRLLAHRVVAALGGMSYEMYLWHVPVLFALRMSYSLIGVEVRCSALTMVVFAAVMILLAVPLWGIEKQVARRLRRVAAQ